MTVFSKAMAPSIWQTFNGQGVRRITGRRTDSTSGSVDSRSGSIGSTQTRTKLTNFSISFSNIRGLRSNFPEVSQFVKDKAPDMLAVSETKLDSSILSAEVMPDGYVVHRQDKGPCHGLAVFVKPNLPLVRLTDYEDSGHEFIAFVAHLEGSTLLLFFIYRSPSANCEIFLM